MIKEGEMTREQTIAKRLSLKRAELIVAHKELEEGMKKVERLEDEIDTLSRVEMNLVLNKGSGRDE